MSLILTLAFVTSPAGAAAARSIASTGRWLAGNLEGIPGMTSATAGNTARPSRQRGRIQGLSEIADAYDVLFCDVWGVLHNGVQSRPDTIAALQAFRKRGGIVIMVTNAPRQRSSVFVQLENFGVPEGTYDTVVTSGDVTRALMRELPRQVLHIGPDKDLNLFEGIDAERVGEDQAQAIVCSGLWHEKTETPQDYVPLLRRLADRGLVMVCANPDIVVEVGDHLEYCAGAIAREYAALGGETLIAGKPHRPIYEEALGEAERLAGRAVDTSRILAIGDGMPTDIAGAAGFGIDALYVSAGIHAAEYGNAEAPDAGRLEEFLSKNGAAPIAWLPRLVW